MKTKKSVVETSSSESRGIFPRRKEKVHTERLCFSSRTVIIFYSALRLRDILGFKLVIYLLLHDRDASLKCFPTENLLVTFSTCKSSRWRHMQGKVLPKYILHGKMGSKTYSFLYEKKRTNKQTSLL